MRDVVVTDCVRTAVGKMNGALSEYDEQELAAIVMKEVLNRSKITAEDVDEVIFGHVKMNTYPMNLAHFGWLEAGLPDNVPGYTLQRACSSGSQSIFDASQIIACGDADIILAGGADSYSAAPFVLRDVRNHFYPQHRTFIDSIEEAELYTQPEPMGRQEQYELAHGAEVSAEAVAYAEESIAKAQNADCAAQILPISYEVRKKGTVTVDKDEWLAAPQSADAPLSPYADGAAVTMLMSEEKAAQLGIQPKAVIGGFAVAGCDPKQMQTSGALAVEKLLKNKGLTMDDISVLEVIENSAQDVLDTVKALGGSPAVNPLGGALAYGKNDGAEGILMVMRLVEALRSGQKGIVCVFSAGGQGMAALIEKN